MKKSKGRRFRSIKAPQKGVRRRPPSNTLLASRKDYSIAPTDQLVTSYLQRFLILIDRITSNEGIPWEANATTTCRRGEVSRRI